MKNVLSGTTALVAVALLVPTAQAAQGLKLTIGGRYMGADRADEYGTRNGVPGELVVRVRPTKVIVARDIAS